MRGCIDTRFLRIIVFMREPQFRGTRVANMPATYGIITLHELLVCASFDSVTRRSSHYQPITAILYTSRMGTVAKAMQADGI